MRFGAVEPRRRGRIVNPRMIWTSVVHHFVLDDLDSVAMRGVDQLAQLRKRAEVFFDAIKILRIVAVKAGARLVFLQLDLVEPIVVVVPRRQPDRSDAEVLEIRQMIDDALKIAAVVVKLVLTIVDAGVVRRIAVSETIDHDQVQHVRRGEPLESSGAIEWSKHFERRACRTFRSGDSNRSLSRRCNKGVDENIRTVLVDLRRTNTQTRNLNARSTQIAPTNQEPYGIHRTPHPPTRRINLHDLRPLRRHRSLPRMNADDADQNYYKSLYLFSYPRHLR